MRTVWLIILLFQIPRIVPAQDSASIKLMFMGDIMQHDRQVKSALTPEGGYDFHPNYKYLKPIIQWADLAIANLEVTLGGPPFKGYPQFSAPDELAVAIQESGIDFLVTANNHSLDRRKKGLERTIDVLDSLGIPHTGTFKDSLHRAQTYPAIIESNGIRIALLNYTYGTNGIPVQAPNIVNYLDLELMRKDIMKAKKRLPDLIIVFTHWGYEYKSLPNSEQKKLTKFFFDNGVNLIIGSHPHVLQPVEWRNSRQLVTYSLGNFISNMRTRYKNGGMILEVDISKQGDSTIIANAGYHLVYTHRTPGPEYQFHLLPTSLFAFDNSITGLDADRSKMTEFISDSRILFKKHNISVREVRNFPPLSKKQEVIGWGGEPMEIKHPPYIIKYPEKVEPVSKQVTDKSVINVSNKKQATAKNLPVRYRIQVMAVANKVDLDSGDYELTIIQDRKSQLFKYQLGGWSSREEAEKELTNIRSVKGWEDAFIVTLQK